VVGLVRRWGRCRSGGGRAGKSLSLPGGGNPDRERTLEEDEARQQLSEESRRTTSRRELAGNELFDELSPEVGVLDEEAVEEALAERPDEALALLAELTGATDERLRELARRLAGRTVIALAHAGASRRRGTGRMRTFPMDETGGDLDLDASMEPLQLAAASKEPADAAQLNVRAWSRPDEALCLLIDRSGSMSGHRLAAAAVAAASAAERAPQDWSVLAFADRVMVLRSQEGRRPVEDVVDDVFRLRGFGPTDLALALRAAAAQLDRSRASGRRVVLLSDCRATQGTEPEVEVGNIDELHVLAPGDDSAEAEAFARAVGARWTALAGPSDVPAAFQRLSG
jgi:Mg-chelatase subunit ChlD